MTSPETSTVSSGQGAPESTDGRLDLRGPGSTVAPAKFQEDVIATLKRRLLNPSTPTLLKAPTGSGKTLMLARAVEETAERTQTVWLWFTPYAHLVGQTMRAIQEASPRLSVLNLATERHGNHRAGDVLVTNVQVVAASNTSARKIYADDDEIVGLLSLVAGARARGLRVGIVVDEAHLGLTRETVFGNVVRQIAPTWLLLASATPRDQKLAEFVAAAGYHEHLTVTVNRMDAVNAGLNKRFVLAHVLAPQERMESIADVHATLLRRAWARHGKIKCELTRLQVAVTPLLLIQVANGEGTVEAAVRTLTETVGVPPSVIGWHSVETPDPDTMASIANDPSREVLVFKESAGTGFDAPRAFVLASMKNVADQSFATQFLGRIMRVDRRLRAVFLRDGSLPVGLDTGFLYLARPEVQEGFEQAVLEVQQMEENLSGVVEEVRARELPDGSKVYTNVPTAQQGLVLQDGPVAEPGPGAAPEMLVVVTDEAVSLVQGTLFEPEEIPPAPAPTSDSDGRASAPATGRVGPAQPSLAAPGLSLQNATDVATQWQNVGVRFFALRAGLPQLGEALVTEAEPTVEDREDLAVRVAERLVISDGDIRAATLTALLGVKFEERRRELTGEAGAEELVAANGQEPVRGILDRASLAREVGSILGDIGFEEADRQQVLTTIIAKTTRDVEELRELQPEASRTVPLQRTMRDVASLLVRAKRRDLAEAYQRELAAKVSDGPASRLPMGVLFPAAVPLPRAERNIYGVRPPTEAEWMRAEREHPRVMGLLRGTGYRVHQLADGSTFPVAYMDGSWRMNEGELRVARALDAARWVRWWHRNPHSKAFSAGVVKTSEPGLFYPDFVVCVEPYEGAPLRQRLVEPKESADDARVKMQRDPQAFGRVIFLKAVGPDQIWVRDRQGNLAEEVGADLAGLQRLLANGF